MVFKIKTTIFKLGMLFVLNKHTPTPLERGINNNQNKNKNI